jgi:hypothetical protein
MLFTGFDGIVSPLWASPSQIAYKSKQQEKHSLREISVLIACSIV